MYEYIVLCITEMEYDAAVEAAEEIIGLVRLVFQDGVGPGSDLTSLW